MLQSTIIDEMQERGPLFIANGLSEDLLASAYLLLKEDDLLKVVFYFGVPTLRGFLEIHERPGTLYLGAFVRPAWDTDPDRVELAGLGWLSGITDVGGAKKADVGFVYLKKWQHGGIPLSLTKLMLKFCFEDLKMDILYGTTPAWNRAALIFGKRLGFTQHPPLPKYCAWDGKPCAAVISYFEREEWEKRNERTQH